MSQGRGEAQQGGGDDGAVVVDHGALEGGERGGQHEDPDQREGQPVEADQSQVFGFASCVNGKNRDKDKDKDKD